MAIIAGPVYIGMPQNDETIISAIRSTLLCKRVDYRVEQEDDYVFFSILDKTEKGFIVWELCLAQATIIQMAKVINKGRKGGTIYSQQDFRNK